MTVPDNTAAQLIWPQSRRGDFLRVLPFYDIDPVTKVKTAKVLTGFLFYFRVLGPDGTVWIDGEIGDGITVTGNVVKIEYERTVYDTTGKVLLKGCQYNVQFDMETPEGFYKPLIEAKLMLT
jgi:hypothetical protein